MFTIDLFDQSIQTCRLTLQEAAKINCLCAIETIVQHGEKADVNVPANAPAEGSRPTSDLPSIARDSHTNEGSTEPNTEPQMNYFAYGLENGTIGVYRLLAITSREATEPTAADNLEHNFNDANQKQQVSLFGERLWRHRSKQPIVALSLFDIDGDGQDELVVGQRNGRLEVRSPFTGQLITKSRCFKVNSQQQQLAGFLKWSLSEGSANDSTQISAASDAGCQSEAVHSQTKRDILIACSSTSSLVAFRPKQRRPHQVLIDYLASGQQLSHPPDRDEFDSDRNFVSVLGQRTNRTPLERHLHLDDQDSDQDGQQSPSADDGNDEDDHAAHGLNKLPISCESKQNPELLQQIGLMTRRGEELCKRFHQVQCELVRKQVALNQATLKLISGDAKSDQFAQAIRLAHSWNFDSTSVSTTPI